MVGKQVAIVLFAGLIYLTPGACNGQKFRWQDDPEYADPFFLGKLTELPGFNEDHRRLQRLLRVNRSGSKLREGLALIRGKEDGISARIFASWLAQVDAPDVKIQEFRTLTKIPLNVAPAAPVVRRRDFSSLTVSYFMDVIVRRSVIDSRLLLREKLSATAKVRHEVVVKMGEKLREENRTTALGRPASMGSGMMIHWAAHFGSGRDYSAARSILLTNGAPGYLRLLAFRGMNEPVETRTASGTLARHMGTQGSELFIPIWPRYKDNIGVALEVARTGQTHPKLAWEATQILAKIKTPSYNFLSLFYSALNMSGGSFIRNKYPGARELLGEIRARRDREGGVEPQQAD